MTESLLLLTALAAIGAAAWFAYRSAQAQTLAGSAAIIKEERDRLAAETTELRAENARLGAELSAAKAGAAARAEAAEEQQRALKEHFAALASQALSANQQQFLALANETFQKHSQAAQGGVKEVLTPAQEQLQKLAASVEALEKSRTQDKAALGEQMRAIGETLRETQGVTGRLVNALRASPKARGRWGEQTLRNVLEIAGLSPHADFTEQFTTTDGEGARLRPDVIIRLPGERCIVVDSKVALSAYLDAQDATDEVVRETLLKKHVQELRSHVKNLASKDYWKHVPETADFVVLFVPGESFLVAAAERDPNLFEDAFQAKVIITTPATMVALAKSVAYGWRQEQSAKNAKDIAELGRELYRRMAIMADHMGKVGDAIGKSVKSYNDLVGSVESRVLPQARKFKELGAGDAGIEVAQPAQIEAAPRQLAPPEQLELMPPPPSRGGRAR
ncbi:MAG: DNA recombination protein RmuC [Hyphomonadaceae bacterium]|nr:DNA recombination protein RmuC [Hyphomonadaceae bacterium]